MKLNFKNWIVNEELNFKDIFGMERLQSMPATQTDSGGKSTNFMRHPTNEDDPINTLDIEYITDQLAKHQINKKRPHGVFVNQVQWGEGVGAIRVKIHPDLHTEISKMNFDLLGDPTWALKKLFIINRSGYGGNEPAIVEELLEQLGEIDEFPIDSPKKDWDGLEKLVLGLTSKIRRVGRENFVYEGIRRMDENDYIIRFSMAGQGAEAPSQRRVVENQTRVFYDADAGRIRMFNKNIETDMGGHNWGLMPSDTDVNFFPTQPREEIIQTMATVMRWY